MMVYIFYSTLKFTGSRSGWMVGAVDVPHLDTGDQGLHPRPVSG